MLLIKDRFVFDRLNCKLLYVKTQQLQQRTRYYQQMWGVLAEEQFILHLTKKTLKLDLI